MFKFDKDDYLARLNKAKKNRGRNFDPRYLVYLIGVLAVMGIVIMGISSFLNRPSLPQEDSRETGAVAVETQEEMVISIEDDWEKEEIEAVLAGYENLGIADVSGYLNIRETPGTDGTIIGKLSGGAACEILDTQGDWSHIISGGVEGYINNQYLLTGEEALERARELVRLRATVTADSLNIRLTPDTADYSNIIGQALEGERYVVEEELDGWIRIEGGYISSDYATVAYSLDEGRKLDMKAMAINQYQNLVISKVNNYLNIRESPGTDGKIIGKMTSKAAGEILETLDGWYKIKSGPITGYISADPEFTATGQEATDLAMQDAQLMAVIRTDVLNVRMEPTTESRIWTQIVKDERYPVVSQLDGWVQIELDSINEEDSSAGTDGAYISTRDNNVEVRWALNEAIRFSPAEEAKNNATSRRSQIVNYAIQFVGNPYVWGGTSLTKGADCSGFTMKVMEHFGVSLPHYSVSQSQMGKKVTSATMRPGDLVFYAGSNGRINHVSMYIGNGQVVHAASRRSGIKISSWNYRTPVAIRNVLGD